MKLIALWASLNLCKYLKATFVFCCASSVVQINLVNNDFTWSVTYSLLHCFNKKVRKKLIKIHFLIWHER